PIRPPEGTPHPWRAPGRYATLSREPVGEETGRRTASRPMGVACDLRRFPEWVEREGVRIDPAVAEVARGARVPAAPRLPPWPGGRGRGGCGPTARRSRGSWPRRGPGP